MKNFYKLLIVIILMISTNSLHSQYSLWTWGDNEYGQLGNDRPEDEPLPIIINDDGDWEKVYSFYAIKKDGTLWTWGNGKDIHLFDDSKWEKIFTYNNYNYRTTYGIKQDGSLWCWGDWNFGLIIVDDSTISNSEPLHKVVAVPVLVDSTRKWNEVEINTRYILAIDEAGALYTWGMHNANMGIGELEDSEDYRIDNITKVGDNKKWVNISSRFREYTFGIQEDGSLWLWGGDIHGLIETVKGPHFSPVKLGDYNCVDIRSNDIGTIFTNINREIFSIGEFNSVISKEPNRLDWIGDIVNIIETDNSCFAIQSKDFCNFIGSNEGLKFGQDYRDSYYNNFISLEYPSMKGYKDIAQIGNGFIFIDSLNNLRAWGGNSNSELGNGVTSIYNDPLQLLPNRTFSDVSCGENYSLAIDEYGMMWAWGDNSVNIWGNSILELNYGNKPAIINYDDDWEKVYTFRNSNFAIKQDGSLWAWGNNRNGKLGVGHNVHVTKPTQVLESGPWKQVYSANSHSIALKSDSTLWGWGVGKDAIGVGIDTVFYPQQIGIDNDWMDIACAGESSYQDSYSVALKSDLTLWGWGNTGYNGHKNWEEAKTFSTPTKLDHQWWRDKFIDLESGERFVTAISEENLIYILSAYHSHTSQGDVGFITNKRSLNTNYDGVIILIDKNGRLLAGKSRLPLGPILSWTSQKLLANYFYYQSEENDWVKATAGRDHIIALRGEYITNVQEPRKLVSANIYPNPSTSNINIDFDSFYNNIRISVYDVYGKLVLESSLSNTDKISINHNLSHGTYILQCRSDSALIVDQVLVVE